MSNVAAGDVEGFPDKGKEEPLSAWLGTANTIQTENDEDVTEKSEQTQDDAHYSITNMGSAGVCDVTCSKSPFHAKRRDSNE